MAIPLLTTCDIAGKDVTGDALLTQRKLAAYVVEQQADYHFTVKGNQPTLEGCLNVFGISARHHVVGLFGFQRLSDGAFHLLQGGMGTGRQLFPELGTGCR